MPSFVIFRHKFHTFIKHKSTCYIYKVKCLIEIYINFTSEFDHGHGPLTFTETQNTKNELNLKL